MMNKSYNELIRFSSFDERFKYLELKNFIGDSTFGYDRYLNQNFYNSKEWRRIRDLVIIRDNGCDLGIDDRTIMDRIIIHHINPITIENIECGDHCVYDLNNLISTSANTHNAIHFGGEKSLIKIPINRLKGDTKLW